MNRFEPPAWPAKSIRDRGTCRVPWWLSMISFSLVHRQEPDGRVAIALRLYRRQMLVSMTTIVVIDRRDAPLLMHKCHAHLVRLGIRNVNELKSVA